MALTPAQLRRWAQDMEKNYGNDPDPRIAALAGPHAECMCAQADYMDAQAGMDNSGVAETADVVQRCPIIGDVTIKGGRVVSVEKPYRAEGEAHGIHTVWEWRDDPTAEERAGELVYLYVGTAEAGPLAMWDAGRDQWYALRSNGNYGKRYAQGGTWSSEKINQPPDVVRRLETIMDKLEQAKRRLKAAELRVQAAHTMDMARSYKRQSDHPVYAGQSEICLGEADVARAIADKQLAEADVIEAGG